MREFLIALMLVVAFVVGGTQAIVEKAEAAGEAEVAVGDGAYPYP